MSNPAAMTADLGRGAGMTRWIDHPSPRRARLLFASVVVLTGLVAALIGTGAVGSRMFLGSSSSEATGVTMSSSATLSLPPNSQVGLFEDLEYISGTALSTRLDQYADLGLRWGRFQMIWGTVQRGGPSSYDWAPYDALVKGLVARGMRPLVIIDTSPTWDRVSGCSAGLTCAPAMPDAYGSFAAAAARRYAPLGVHDWEIWNEPNNDAFWAPTPDPVAYSKLLKGAYAAIKGVDPKATVITGGLAPAVTSSGHIAPVEYLADIYHSGGHGSFDAVGWHPYTFPEMPGVTDSASAWYQMYGTATSARSVMVDNGDGAKRIWGTEFGAPTDPKDPTSVTETAQAHMFTKALSLWSSYSWAGPFIGYQYQDSGTNTSDLQDFFGLTRANGSPKPALHAFRAAIARLEHRS